MTLQWPFPFRLDGAGVPVNPGAEAHLDQLIEQVLFTRPGERVNRPTFGVGVSAFVFGAVTSEQASAIASTVKAQLQQALANYLVVLSVTATPANNDTGTLQLDIAYRPHGSSSTSTTSVVVSR